MTDHRYLVSARKYRPSSFEEVVGQEHVTETLKNAIRLDRLAHAYLFSGPRGVGKTTGARILAKAINCETPLDKRTDASEPCQTCPSCVTFDEGRSLNVIEVDAASNNKVDDVRDLRETVRIPPQGAKKKVYIIDEVHMLTAQAFNALLKTLEEPPPYVLFIFATTEPHKVLPTILSRCQRFDFRRISIPEIVAQLEMISKSENITADEASLMLIARKGDGALRDALSAFDQAVALCGTDIRYEDLAKAFRVVDVDIYFEVSDCAQRCESAGMLGVVDRVVTEGYDLHEFLNGLLGHLRNIFVARSMSDARLIEATAEVQKQYLNAASAFSEQDLLRMMTVVAETEESLRFSAQPRLTVELGALKLVQMSSVEDIRTLLERAKSEPPDARPGPAAAGATPAPAAHAKAAQTKAAQTKAAQTKVAQTKAAQPAPPRPSAPTSKPEVARTTSTGSAPALATRGQTNARGASSEGPQRPDQNAARRATNTEADADAAFAEASARGQEHEPDSSAPAPSAPTRKSQPNRQTGSSGSDELTDARSAPAPSTDTAPSLFGPPALKRQPRDSARSEPSPRTEGSAALATAPAVTAEKSQELRDIESIWLAYVRSVKTNRIHVGALLQHASPAGFTGELLSISVPDDFHRRLLTNQHDFLREQLLEHTDVRIGTLSFDIRADHAIAEEEEEQDAFDPHEYLERKRQENPMIKALFDEFGGELVW